MYRSYFSFSDFPFECNLDQRFLYLSESHREVLAAILYFITEKKGFALVCGDVGTGKTMLLNQLLNRLPENIHPIRIAVPDVDYTQLLLYIARSLGIKDLRKNALDLNDEVESVLVEMHRKGRQVVLIIDEAHMLTNRSLEYIRILSNIETQKSKLLQILLVGQYELSSKLDLPEMRPLRQRININRFLTPMSAAETIAYINHRLELVGSSYTACFESSCEGLIWRLTKGVPRRINQLCDNALLICESEGKQKVNRKMLNRADEALKTDRIFKPDSNEEKGEARSGSYFRAVFFMSLVLVLALAGILASGGNIGQNARRLTRDMIATVAQPYHAVRDWMFTGKLKEISNPGKAVRSGTGPVGDEADPAKKQADRDVLAKESKSLDSDTDSRREKETDSTLINALKGNSGEQLLSRPPVIKQVPSLLEAQQSDIGALQGSSQQSESSGLSRNDSGNALPGADASDAGVSEARALAPALSTDDLKDGPNRVPPVLHEDVNSSSMLEAYQKANLADGATASSGVEGRKELKITSKATTPASSGPGNSSKDEKSLEATEHEDDGSIHRDPFNSANVRHIVVKKGDTLAKIAAAQYPRNPELGFKAILLANPTIVKPDQIIPGQTLVLPGLDSVSEGTRFRDTDKELLRLLRTQ